MSKDGKPVDRAADDAIVGSEVLGSRLSVVHPVDVIKNFNYKGVEGGMNVKLAPFGRFQTGTSIQAPLFYPPVGIDGCSDMTSSQREKYNMYWKGFVLLLDGGCTYEEKARRVEKMGAHALIIAHNPNTFVDGREWHSSDSRYDGSGFSISIPTFIVDNQAGSQLIKLMQGRPNFDEQVVLKADIELATAESQTISYSLFYGSLLDLDSKFIAELYDYQHALQDRAFFIPRILTFECPGCPKSVLETHCFGNGKYCFTPPPQAKLDLFPKLSVEQLVSENLRQRCVYEVLAEKPDELDSHEIFNYLYNMQTFCLEVERELTKTCSELMMRNLQIPVNEVVECVKSSESEWSDENRLLQSDRDIANELGITMNPSLTINSKVYHGRMQAADIFSELCHAYHPVLQPSVCQRDFDLTTVLGHAETDFSPPYARVDDQKVVFVGVMVVLFNVFLFLYCINRKKKESTDRMQRQV